MHVNRRDFIGGCAAAVGASALPAFAKGVDEMRGALLHFGTNMWQNGEHVTKLDFDYDVWQRLTQRMADLKMNYVLIDLGEGLVYPSHPEIAVEGSWTPERFREELARLRKMGLEPLPKLNFSCGHNGWMGSYRRCVSTKKYYAFQSDLVKDVAAIFDTPRLFHIGYDEETAGIQKGFPVCIVRQGDLWWHDFLALVGDIEKACMRPWMWSDYAWAHPDFFQKCPKGVLQSNWYYRQWFDFNDKDFPKNRHVHLRTFLDLDKAGFDQVVCGSNWATDANMVPLVKYARDHIKPELLKGFMMATWEMSVPAGEAKLLRGLDQLADGLKAAPDAKI